MKTCFIYAGDRESEAQSLFATLRQYGIVDILIIDPASTREEQQHTYQEVQAAGIILSQGLKDNPLLNALVDIATDDAIFRRKVVFPISFTPEHGGFVYLEQYAGITLYSNTTEGEQKQRFISHQLQKLVRLIEKRE